jgi:hypothetical protein
MSAIATLFAGWGMTRLVDLAARFCRKYGPQRLPNPIAAALLRDGIVAATVLATLGFHVPFLQTRWTHLLEYRFVLKNLAKIDDGCLIVRHGRGGCDAGLQLDSTFSTLVGGRHRWMDVRAFLSRAEISGCTVYYETAACHVRNHHDMGRNARVIVGDIYPECEEMRNRFDLKPIVEAKLPGRPYLGEDFTRVPVPVGFYEIWHKRR